jgi:predicted TIM-barrel fold metal-dependent hydrolase
MKIIDGYVSVVGSLQRFTSDHANLMRAKKGLAPRTDLDSLTPESRVDHLRDQGLSSAYTICESAKDLRSDWQVLNADYKNVLDFFSIIPSVSEDFMNELPLLPELVAEGLRAIHFRPGKWKAAQHLNSRDFDAIYQTLSDLKLPLYVMCGGITGPNISYSDPAIVDDIASRFPNLRIVLTHGGWPYVLQMCGMLHRRSNVWCMPDAYFPGFPGWRSYLEAMESFGQDRFIFSSIFPYTDVDDHIAAYQKLGVSDDVLEKAYSLNVERLFDFDFDIHGGGPTELPH